MLCCLVSGGAGYLPWADANNIVVVFPQATSNLLNPKGCWDLWGYTGPQVRCSGLLVVWVGRSRGPQRALARAVRVPPNPLLRLPLRLLFLLQYASNIGTQTLAMKRVFDVLMSHPITPNRTELVGAEAAQAQWEATHMHTHVMARALGQQ